MALRGNHTLGGSQASENIVLTRSDGLAVLQCVSLKQLPTTYSANPTQLGERFPWLFLRHSCILFASTGTPPHCF
jgi:hypothetical protein